MTNTGRATAEIPSSSTSSRYSGAFSNRPMKVIKILIDNNYTFTINVPEKITLPIIEETYGNQRNSQTSQQQYQVSQGQTFEVPTCGWLIEQVQIKYAQLVKELKNQSSTNHKFKKKIIVALKTADKNENIDFYLTQYSRPLKPLPNNLVLEPHYTKIIKDKIKPVLSNEFELLKVIGKGGFSKVYMARKKDTGFIYAMKVMKKEQITNEFKLRQIMNERTIMEQLSDHPFVVKLHYAFQSKENLHFIIDFCSGGEMFYHLQQNGRFPEFLAKFYFVEILLGLEYLHSKSIVYRDLKPENVLIDLDGHIKIADFGLSKIFKPEERSFSFCGSPEYMCPEILKREGHNHMVDYYTLGAMLYEMLTGLPPYYTNNKSEMTRRILESELTFPQYLNPETVSLMKGLLERNPSKRLGSQRGIEEIKQHEWCSDVDWDMFLQKKIVPPWKPKLDQSNFDPEYTQLPLNFDEANFKRALQGGREFSIYYESPIQSLTVTEHSIYASNPDLTNTTNAELQLQSGSSKQLLEHFFNQQTQKERQPTILLGAKEINDIYQQQVQKMQINMDMALRINNENLMRDESKASLDNNNEEDRFNNLRGFSFFGENEDEREVKRQLIKYTKLRNKLNARLKKIQDEEGVIKQSYLKEISLSTPSSSLSLETVTVLPTPPVVDDGTSASRYSNPSQYQRINTNLSNNQAEQHSLKSGSPQPMYHHHVKNTVIDKKSKQQMIFSKLGEAHLERSLFKSFQPSSNEYSKMSSMTSGGGGGGLGLVGSGSGVKKKKKNELFRSNVETPNSGLLLPQAYNNQLSHKDYLNESIQQSSSDDQEESIAEERDSFSTVNQTNPNNPNPHTHTHHQTLNSAIDFYRSHLEESKELYGNNNNNHQLDQDYDQESQFQFNNNSNNNNNHQNAINEEAKSSINLEEESKDYSPRESIKASGSALKNVKFILFQSQNVNKKFTLTSINKQSKTPKLIMTQRSRMSSKKEEVYFPPQSQSHQISSLSNSGNNSRLQIQQQNSTTVGAGSSAMQVQQRIDGSSSSQAMTSSRDNQNTTNEHKSMLEKTTDCASTKNTLEHNSQKSATKIVKQKQRTPIEDDQQSERNNPNDASDDLDKTTNIMSLNQIENHPSAHKKTVFRQLEISPRKLQKNAIDLSKQSSDQSQQNNNGNGNINVNSSLGNKNKTKIIKRPNLEIDVNSSPLMPKKKSSQNHIVQNENQNLIQSAEQQIEEYNNNDQDENDDGSVQLEIVEKAMHPQVNEEEDEFIITRIKKVANTVKAQNTIDSQHNFQFEHNTQHQNNTEEFNNTNTSVTSQNTNNSGILHGIKAAAQSIGDRIKKMGMHQKKISADQMSGNEFFNTIRDKIMTREIDLFENNKNIAKTQSKNTPTHQEKKHFIIPTPQEKNTKNDLLMFSQNDDKLQLDAISDNNQQSNISQSSHKKQGTGGVSAKYSHKKLTGYTNLKQSQTLKKGTTATASTVGFPRQQPETNNQQQFKQTKTTTFQNKPPLNQQNMRHNEMSGYNAGIGSGIKKTSGYGNKTGLGGNSGAGTPQGNKQTVFGIQKSKFSGNFASSQPSSAKNASSSKFTFPSLGTSLDQSHPSPGKKLTSQRSNMSGTSNHSKTNAQGTSLNNPKQQTQTNSFLSQQNDNNQTMNSDQLRIPKQQQQQQMPTSTQNIQALKPPKTTKNISSNAKGFFQ